MIWYNVDTAVGEFKDATISLNDDNKKPKWVEIPAKFSEFHITRNKKNLVLVIGESWTYGESLGSIATGLKRYNLDSQLTNCFGPRISLLMDCDYYQYAIPGNCNAFMFWELERILNHLSVNFNYDNIYLYMQMTEPSRELAIRADLKETPFEPLFNFPPGLPFTEWLIRYDELFLDILEKSIKQHSNVKALVWKNFCCFQNRKQYSTFTILKDSWIKFSGKCLGVDLEMQKFQSVGWFDDFSKQYPITYSANEISLELDKIEKSNAFINGNFLHNNHPNVIAHQLWALTLYNNTPK